ncbi:MAG: 1,4-alpha-glucan branching protein GlgB [Rhizobiaceae bacterium]
MPIGQDDTHKIIAGTHEDPYAVLGMHLHDGKVTVSAYLPGADAIKVLDAKTGRAAIELEPVPGSNGLFSGQSLRRKKPFSYKLQVTAGENTWQQHDAYGFSSVLGDMDLHLFNEGSHKQLWQMLGAHCRTHQNVDGVHFAVWAPNASQVSLVGDFNGWNTSTHMLRPLGHSGVWEIFVPGIGEGQKYKYQIRDRNGQFLPQKADPVGFGAEHPPSTASVVRALEGFEWTDQQWLTDRQKQYVNQPMSIYEVHLGSWKKVPEEGNRPLSYLEHAAQLVDYVKDLGFTHIELMPISEFPFDGSWGYQPVGLFAPTIRYGTPNEFRAFVDTCHNAGIGLLLDWVPGHFPEDPHGLGQFDGTALYEHADRKEGFHPDWNTLLYNYGRREVANYLIANAVYWLQEHHIDGLRVDAVASMLYRDYSRKEGEWVPNIHGGRENLEAIDFLKRMNETAYGEMPGIMTVAEESTAFPGVSAPTDQDGLGFGFKWNMGWMNDTLSYLQEDPINRKYHHHKMTFGLHYAFSENFILPISHDEVVHGKGAMINKMPGNLDEKFANLRAYYGFMWGHPGKKLLFMGNEIAQHNEWNHDASLDWHLLEQASHRGIQNLIRDLNALYRDTPSLHELDCDAAGFEWIEGGAMEESLFCWLRKGSDETTPVLIVSNFTPVERHDRRIGVPEAGHWREVLNTDSSHYGGGDRGNMGDANSEAVAASDRDHSIVITIPPLTTLFLKLERP